jgi:transcription-repair coupling factor (superfamily II helicase)
LPPRTGGGGPRGSGRFPVRQRLCPRRHGARAGDFALRGGIVDLWPPGEEQPLRLDFFGSTLDAIRRFDAETQLSDKTAVERDRASARQRSAAERAAISRFRSGYVAAFGAAGDDPLYESVSAGRKTAGMEHWLPAVL